MLQVQNLRIMEESRLILSVLWCVLATTSTFLPLSAGFRAVSRDQLGYKYMNFYLKPNTVLTDSSIKVHSNVPEISSCQLLCLHHTSCLSINHGKKPNQTTLHCELNNSTSVLKPRSLKKQEGFDFYGLAEPCFSAPCLNGGTCIQNMTEGTYRCNCSTQIPYLPYLDQHCSVDHSLIQTSGMFHNVFHFHIVGKRYPLNYYEAERACAIQGARMASLKELEDGWKAGFDFCGYGWLIEGTAGYPIIFPKNECGGIQTPPGIRGGTHPMNKLNSRFDVYCYRETDNCNDENWHQNNRHCYKFFLDTKARQAAASQTCALEGAVLGVFNDKAKLAFITDYLQRRGVTDQHILVGLSQDAGGVWKWTSGAAVQSSLWNVTQPTGPIGTVNPVTKSLDNVPDSDQWKLPFVCQKPVS